MSRDAAVAPERKTETKTYEYHVRIKVMVPAELDVTLLDKAMWYAMGVESGGEDVENALYYDHEELLGDAPDDADRFGVTEYFLERED